MKKGGENHRFLSEIRYSGNVPHTPIQFFWKYPLTHPEGGGEGGVSSSFIHKWGSLCQAFLAETVETVTKNRCVSEATHV